MFDPVIYACLAAAQLIKLINGLQLIIIELWLQMYLRDTFRL